MGCRNVVASNRVGLCFLLLTGIGALWAHLALAWGAFHVNNFDSALFLLQPMYASRGLRPYIDYGFLYPPGPALLFGTVLHLHEVSQIQIAVALLNALAVGGCAMVLFRQAKSHRLMWAAGAMLCIGFVIPMASMGLSTDPCPLTLTCLTLLLLLAVVRRGRSRLLWFAFATTSAVTTLWRWERVLPSVLVLALAALALRISAARFVHDRRRLTSFARQLAWAALAGFAGISAAFTLMAAYAIATGSWAAEREFVFRLPLIILPYRRLPLPYPSGENMQWAANCLALVLLTVAGGLVSLRAQRSLAHQIKRGVVLIGPLTLLPYSFNRADQLHFLPIAAAVMIAILAGASIWHSHAARSVLTLALLLVLWPLTSFVSDQAALQGLPLKRDIYAREAEQLTAPCSSLIPSDAKSLFVGEASYQRYLYNVPLLYVANPELRPATPFISDEPGVQNTCNYGQRIADHLSRAPRPTAIALDSSGWHMEPNLSAKMQTCGKIEAELSENMTPIGACVLAGRVFTMGVIK